MNSIETTRPACAYPSCGREAVRRGLCWAHREQERRGTELFDIGSHRISLVERFHRNVNKNGPVVRPELGQCWSWKGATFRSGYGNIRANGKPTGAHRVSWQIHIGQIPAGEGRGTFVLHRCDNRGCVRPEHLFLGDHAANMKDMVQKGRRVAPTRRATSEELRHGSEHPNAKLSEEGVRDIRSRALAGETFSDIAARHSVTRQNVRHVVDGKTWRHVK